MDNSRTDGGLFAVDTTGSSVAMPTGQASLIDSKTDSPASSAQGGHTVDQVMANH